MVTQVYKSLSVLLRRPGVPGWKCVLHSFHFLFADQVFGVKQAGIEYIAVDKVREQGSRQGY